MESTNPSDPSTVIRIAIAFAALKYKPRDQSTASYVLDLQSQFPLLGITDEIATPSQSSDSANRWRAHALGLEKQLRVLQEQRNADQEELVRLRCDAAQMQAKKPTPSDAPPPKKKAKKNKEYKDFSDTSWNWDSVRADWSKFLNSQYPPAPSLLLAYTSLRGAILYSSSVSPQTITTFEGTEASVRRIADAIIRAVEVIYAFLFLRTQETTNFDSSATVTSSSLSQHVPAHLPSCCSSALSRPLSIWTPSVSHGGRYENLTSSRIATSSPLLMYTVHTAFPALLQACAQLVTLHNRHRGKRETFPLGVGGQGQWLGEKTGYEQVDRVLDNLLELILLPLVHAFRPLCRTRLMPFFEREKKTSGGESRAASLASKQTVAKEFGQEKEKGKKGKSKASQNSSSPTGAAPCILTDVRKDTLALLGATIRALVTPFPSSSSKSASTHGRLQDVTHGIRERVGLEAIRELEALYKVCYDDSTDHSNTADHTHPSSVIPPSPAPSHHLPSTFTATTTTVSAAHSLNVGAQTLTGDNSAVPTETVVPRDSKMPLMAVTKRERETLRANMFQTLVTKDAAWYLCSVLHLVVLPSESGRATSPLLMRAVIEGVGRVLRFVIPDVGIRDGQMDDPGTPHGHENSSNSKYEPSSRSATTPVDPVTQNILLAICEQAMCEYAEIDPGVDT